MKLTEKLKEAIDGNTIGIGRVMKISDSLVRKGLIKANDSKEVSKIIIEILNIKK